MQAAIVLCGKARASGNFLRLHLSIPVQRDLRANRAAIAGCSFQLKFDPFIRRIDSIFVKQQRTFLIGDNHVQHSTIPQVGQSYGTAVVGVGDTDSLRDIDELTGAVVQPDAFVLISRQAAAFKRRPVFSVSDNRAVAARHFGKVVPVAAIAVERNVAIRQIKIERAVVVEITELRAKTPPAEFYAEVARQVFVLNSIAGSSRLRHP